MWLLTEGLKLQETLKRIILKAGAEGSIGVVTIDNRIDQANIIKRIANQLVKATRLQSDMITDFGIDRASLVGTEPAK